MAALLVWEPCTLVVIKLANPNYKSMYSSFLFFFTFGDLHLAFVHAWKITPSLALPPQHQPRGLYGWRAWGTVVKRATARTAFLEEEQVPLTSLAWKSAVVS